MSRHRIKALLLVGLAVIGVSGIGAARSWAEGRGDPFPRGERHGRWAALSAEDRAAFTDARIAGLHAGLKLTPDQEKLWPPVEGAIRDLAKQRDAQREARRERRGMTEDAPGRLRSMADAATARGEALRKLADATTPLFASLDEAQKRRAMMLARPLRGPHGGWRHHGPNREE